MERPEDTPKRGRHSGAGSDPVRFCGWPMTGCPCATPRNATHAVDAFMSAVRRQGTVPSVSQRAFLAAFARRAGIDFEALPEAEKHRLLSNDTRALAASIQDRPSLEPLLEKMDMPCLLYPGDADGSFAQMRKAATAIPNCNFVSLPGYTHNQAFHGAATEILPHARTFLRGRHSVS